MCRMIKWLCLLLLLLSPSQVMSVGFTTQSPKSAYNSGLGFELGEAAINSFLASELKDPVLLGNSGQQVTVAVKRAEFDFENGVGTFYLRVVISHSGGTQIESFTEVLHPGIFVYSSTAGKLTMYLGNIFNPRSLPSSVKALLNSHFSVFTVYSKSLYSLAGLPTVGTQVSSIVPLFYMGHTAPNVQFHDDFIRISSSPKWEMEVMKAEGYRQNFGSDSVLITFIANYSAELMDVGYARFVIYHYVVPGVYNFSPEPTYSNIRYRRYNVVIKFPGTHAHTPFRVLAKVKTHDNRIIRLVGDEVASGSFKFNTAD